jgi:hypothetical protein
MGLTLSATNMVDDIVGQKSITGFFKTSSTGPDAGSDPDLGADPPRTTTDGSAVPPVTASGISSCGVIRHHKTVRAVANLKWACVDCTFINAARDRKCAMCGGATTAADSRSGSGADSANPPSPPPKRMRMSATERIAHQVRSERGIGKYF